MWSNDFGGGGMWLFPMMMMLIMLFVVSRMFSRGGGFRPPWMQGQGSDRQPSENTAPETAVELLKKRYARGEITKEEFEQIQKDL